jgi:dipicolinate synthase subunit A
MVWRCWILADFIIHQTDARMFFLRQELGFSPKRTTHIFAPNILLTAKTIDQLTGGEVVIGGKADNEALALFNSLDVKYFNMLDDEIFQARNARLTAEGTLDIILSHSFLSLDRLKALVIGFGRTGSAVVKILRDVGIGRLTVATTSSLRPAMAFADNVIKAKDFDFTPYDIVINTAPQQIIDDKEVLTMSPNAIYIDLASKPALSLNFAKYLGIDAEIYPALPAKTAPISAGEAIAEYVRRVLK